MTKRPANSPSNSESKFVEQVKSQFNTKEWEWLMKDENCRNVLDGSAKRRDLFGALFYLRFRVPSKLRRLAFLAD